MISSKWVKTKIENTGVCGIHRGLVDRLFQRGLILATLAALLGFSELKLHPWNLRVCVMYGTGIQLPTLAENVPLYTVDGLLVYNSIQRNPMCGAGRTMV